MQFAPQALPIVFMLLDVLNTGFMDAFDDQLCQLDQLDPADGDRLIGWLLISFLGLENRGRTAEPDEIEYEEVAMRGVQFPDFPIELPLQQFPLQLFVDDLMDGLPHLPNEHPPEL